MRPMVQICRFRHFHEKGSSLICNSIPVLFGFGFPPSLIENTMSLPRRIGASTGGLDVVTMQNTTTHTPPNPKEEREGPGLRGAHHNTAVRKRLKKCRGCATLFVNCSSPTPKFVISHDERRIFWTKYGRRESMQKVFYHCVKPRHPYFKSREFTIVPSLVDKVTADDIELAKRHGVDLSFVTLKDTECRLGLPTVQEWPGSSRN